MGWAGPSKSWKKQDWKTGNGVTWGREMRLDLPRVWRYFTACEYPPSRTSAEEAVKNQLGKTVCPVPFSHFSHSPRCLFSGPMHETTRAAGMEATDGPLIMDFASKHLIWLHHHRGSNLPTAETNTEPLWWCHLPREHSSLGEKPMTLDFFRCGRSSCLPSLGQTFILDVALPSLPLMLLPAPPSQICRMPCRPSWYPAEHFYDQRIDFTAEETK